MIEVVNFETRHLLEFDLQHEQREEFSLRTAIAEHPDFFAYVSNFAWSLECDGKIVGCVGMIPYVSHWMAWAMLSDEALKHPKSLSCSVRLLIENVHPPDLPLRAVAEFPRAKRWAEWLGFEQDEEGLVWPQVPRYKASRR